MRPLDGVAWFLASAMLLLTLAGCGVFGLGALVLLPFDRLRDRSGERVVVVTATAAAPTETVMAPTVTAPAAVVVVEVAPTVARSGLVLLPLVVGPVASAPAAVVAPVVMPTFTPWPTITPWPTFTLWPTFTPWPTATVTPWARATPIYSWRATINGVEFGSDCPCDQGNFLNCDDFPGDNGPHSAQSCYLRCIALVGEDVHGLDGHDNDGLACEYKN